MKKTVLVIANGGREHAICEALKRSSCEVDIVVFGSAVNPAIRDMAMDYEVGDICNCDEVVRFAKKHNPDFAIAGPEAPIAAGVVDALLKADIHTVAPLKYLAQLESSKGYTRDLLNKYGIPANPGYERFESEDGMREFAEKYDGQFVVKADGLRGGKGVSVAGDHFQSIDEGLTIAKEYLEQDGIVVLEEKLVGQEFSLMTFTDGVNCVDMPCVQDHKRAFVGDEGPNTGGMGSYSDADHLLPFLHAEEVDVARQVTKDVANALYDETGEKFKGVMYGGFIATKNGVKLIEYNVRFGDPESVNVLPILKTDFVDVCEAILYDGLDKLEVEFENKATVCKYVVPEGYPENPAKGVEIEVGDVPEGVKLYYAAVDEKNGKLYMTGSRAIAVVGIADSIEQAEKLAEKGAQAIKGPVFYREDVGTEALIAKRVAMMEEIRG